jgi:hypothetical protein
VNWQSKRAVLLLIGGICLILFLGGMGAFWHNRHRTICKDGQPPAQQQSALLGQTVYLCHNGQTVTTS